MIHGIGTDIVHVPRVSLALSRWGERFAHRILHEDEWVAFRDAALPANHLAKRYAAKEAWVKALGTGFRDGLSLKHIAIQRSDLGKPELTLRGRAAQLATAQGIGAQHLSLADERDYAVAYVVLEKG